MNRRRLRTFTLWTGTLLCVLIAAAFVVSGWYHVRFRVPTPLGPDVHLENGAMAMVVRSSRRSFEHFAVTVPSGSWVLWNDWRSGSIIIGSTWMSSFFTVPLYAAFAAVAPPTLLVWRLGSKPVKPGHCPCGYNLTGNLSGVCPECGKRAD